MVTEIQEKILNAAIDEFAQRGLKFTMNDVAKNLGMSKKTIYTIYESKEEMLLALADYCFQDIKKSEKIILQDNSMDVLTKIERIMVVLPEKYQNIGLSNLYQLKEKYPHVYQRTAKYLETDWDDHHFVAGAGNAGGKDPEDFHTGFKDDAGKHDSTVFCK